MQIVHLAAWGILPWRLGTTEALTQAYAMLTLVGLAGVVAASWYGLNLAKRLRDRALAVNLQIIVSLVGIVCVLTAIAFVADPAKAVETFARGLAHPPDGETFYKTFSARIKWVGVLVGVNVWMAWTLWRFARRLRSAAEKLRGQRSEAPDSWLGRIRP